MSRAPLLGDIVLYCDPQMGDEAPAIVTAAYSNTAVGLTVFQVNQPPNPVRGAVECSATDQPIKGAWRWPPRS